jgi:hypothetical protein
MSTIIRARSPYYLRKADLANFTSATISVYIYEGVSPADLPASAQYTLNKEAINGELAVTFEISELIRDYFDNVYDGNYNSSAGSVLQVRVITQQYVSSGSLPTAITDDYLAFDSYSEFQDGVNFGFLGNQIPFDSDILYKLSNKIYVPVLAEETTQLQFKYNGAVVQTTAISDNGNTNQKIQYPNYTGNVDQVIVTTTSGLPRTFTIETIEECKYPTYKITFINKYGVLEDVWFHKKSVELMNTTKEQFNRNLLNRTALSYSTKAHSKNVYNKIANQSILLNSGFYPEDYNSTFEQLILSEFVWMTKTGSSDIHPMVVSDSSFTYKTNLNDKLINYAINFDYAYDLINNVH